MSTVGEHRLPREAGSTRLAAAMSRYVTGGTVEPEVVAETDPRSFIIGPIVGIVAGVAIGSMLATMADIPGRRWWLLAVITAATTAVSLLATLGLWLILGGNAVLASPEGLWVRRRGKLKLALGWDEVDRALWREGTWWVVGGWINSTVIVGLREHPGLWSKQASIGRIAPSRRRARAAVAAHARTVLARYAPAD